MNKMDLISQVLGKLSIRDDDTQSCKFRTALKGTGLKIFTPIEDKGYFTWSPMDYSSTLQGLEKVNSAKAIKAAISIHGTPDILKDLKKVKKTTRLPRSFLSLPPNEKDNLFPYGQIDVASMHVAAHHRGVDWTKIDFCFGGSTLEMLAQKSNKDPYKAVRIPGTKTICVSKSKRYTQNQADPGFQFERLMTGKGMSERSDWKSTEHIHIMKVDEFNVLFMAEVDAMDEKRPVEIKASNPRYWGTKVMFQMISNGSPTLCHGIKRFGQLADIELLTLEEVSETAMNSSFVPIEKNIIEGMKSLKSILKMEKKENDTFSVQFSGGRMQLIPTRDEKILPSPKIVKELVL